MSFSELHDQNLTIIQKVTLLSNTETITSGEHHAITKLPLEVSQIAAEIHRSMELNKTQKVDALTTLFGCAAQIAATEAFNKNLGKFDPEALAIYEFYTTEANKLLISQPDPTPID